MTAQGRLLGGRYQVGELLGFGGMAEVNRGRDTRLGRDVAIKTLRRDLARDATFQLRFEREAQNAASLNHPAIVAVYDTGSPTGDELPYFVMEYVNGRTLKEVLAIEERIEPKRALEIVADVCSALDFSHRHGIIHRDVKPGNVMLTQTGQVKVMDFGIARALASGVSTMTATSAVIGTAQYLAPEQARGEPVDARSDVYATGCLVFELLTGQPPFIGDNAVSVIYQHVREEPPAPGINPDIDSVVLKALSKNPADRYQSAGEMRVDLLRAAAGRPVSAAPALRATIPPPVPDGRRGGAPRGGPKKGSTALVVLITVLSMLAVGVIGVGLFLANRDIEVPSLAGKTAPEAADLLSAEGLAGTQQTTDKCDQAASLNRIISQTPAANATVAKGSVVTFQVCVAPGQVPIPDLKGKSRAEVEKILAGLKLKGTFEPVDSADPKDTVIGTSPVAGTAVPVNGSVTVRISLDNQRKMPDLTGKTEREARDALKNGGFDPNKLRINEQTADADDVGKVIRQNPSANSVTLRSATITVVVGQKADNPPPSSKPSSPSPSAS